MAGFLYIKKPYVNMMLTGHTEMAWDVDTESGKQSRDAYQMTGFCSAAFFSPDEMQDFKHARSSISGLLVCGFGL